MSTALSQVLLHPALVSTIKVSHTTVGRDKLYRAIQYFSRFLSWYLFRKGYSKETVARFGAIKSSLGTGRKMMRLGKFVEHFQAATKAAEIPDPVLRATAVGRQLGYGFYLIHDAMVWAHNAKVKVFAADTMTGINRRAAQFWLSGLVFSIISGVYRLRDLQFREIKARKARPTPEKEADRKVELRNVLQQRAAVRYQLVQDLLDSTIPSSTLGFVNLDDGVVGLAGFVSSLMGLRTQVNKVIK